MGNRISSTDSKVVSTFPPYDRDSIVPITSDSRYMFRSTPGLNMALKLLSPLGFVPPNVYTFPMIKRCIYDHLVKVTKSQTVKFQNTTITICLCCFLVRIRATKCLLNITGIDESREERNNEMNYEKLLG